MFHRFVCRKSFHNAPGHTQSGKPGDSQEIPSFIFHKTNTDQAEIENCLSLI
jgi:hypothetical protein